MRHFLITVTAAVFDAKLPIQYNIILHGYNNNNNNSVLFII